MKNSNKNNKLTTEVINTTSQTPIEVALQIDENGMTTASNLYDFLELEPKNFARWCKTNIKNNKFAIENEDYISFVIEEERHNPNPKTDYKLSSDFAKKLSMTGNTERHEQARQYFVACEQGLKIATTKLQNNINMQQLTDALANLTQTIASMANNTNEQLSVIDERLTQLEQSQRNRYLLEKRYPSAWYKKMAPKYKLLQEYFDCTRAELYSNIYKELEDTYDVDINQIHEDYCYENHLLKDECYPMDAIEHSTKLRDALTLLIDTSLIKYGLQTEEQIKNFKRETLFDRKPIIKEAC